jgi:hypothetical protein
MSASRIAGVFLIALGGTLAATWLAERGFLGLGTGSGSISDAIGALARLDGEGEELDRLNLLTNQRTDALVAISADVAAGRLGLLKAAAEFRAADEMLPSRLRVSLMDCSEGASPDERDCRRVIDFVAESLAEEPVRRDAVVARLTAELEAHLRQSSSARLEETGSGPAQRALVGSPNPVHAEMH